MDSVARNLKNALGNMFSTTIAQRALDNNDGNEERALDELFARAMILNEENPVPQETLDSLNQLSTALRQNRGVRVEVSQILDPIMDDSLFDLQYDLETQQAADDELLRKIEELTVRRDLTQEAFVLAVEEIRQKVAESSDLMGSVHDRAIAALQSLAPKPAEPVVAIPPSYVFDAPFEESIPVDDVPAFEEEEGQYDDEEEEDEEEEEYFDEAEAEFNEPEEKLVDQTVDQPEAAPLQSQMQIPFEPLHIPHEHKPAEKEPEPESEPERVPEPEPAPAPEEPKPVEEEAPAAPVSASVPEVVEAEVSVPDILTESDKKTIVDVIFCQFRIVYDQDDASQLERIAVIKQELLNRGIEERLISLVDSSSEAHIADLLRSNYYLDINSVRSSLDMPITCLFDKHCFSFSRFQQAASSSELKTLMDAQTAEFQQTSSGFYGRNPLDFVIDSTVSVVSAVGSSITWPLRWILGSKSDAVLPKSDLDVDFSLSHNNWLIRNQKCVLRFGQSAVLRLNPEETIVASSVPYNEITHVLDHGADTLVFFYANSNRSPDYFRVSPVDSDHIKKLLVKRCPVFSHKIIFGGDLLLAQLVSPPAAAAPAAPATAAEVAAAVDVAPPVAEEAASSSSSSSSSDAQ